MKCQTWTVTILALAVSFGLIFGTSYYQGIIYDDNKNKANQDQSDLWLLRINSIIPSMGIVVINMILSRAIRRFASYERSETITQYNSGVAIRLVIA
jgi:hypothetical protein